MDLSDDDEKCIECECERQHRLRVMLFEYWRNQYTTMSAASEYFLRFMAMDDMREYRADFSVNVLKEKVDRLQTAMSGHASLMRNFCGFYLNEWEEFRNAVCPVMEIRARDSRTDKRKKGRPTKLSTEERLSSAVLFLKNAQGCRAEASCWNASKTTLNADVTFVCECIIEALKDQEIRWPNAQIRENTRTRLGDLFDGCIGHIDGTLCKIQKPRIYEHKKYFNNRKAIYCMNCVIVVDHDGLIIYVDAGFAGSFHDARCLENTELGLNWRDYFTQHADLDEILEFLLGDPGYLGWEMFIMRRVDAREIVGGVPEGVAPGGVGNPVLDAFNARHAGRRVKVEWGIGGLKNKWRVFLGTFPLRRDCFKVAFEAAAVMTNFIHRRRMRVEMVNLPDLPIDNDDAGGDEDQDLFAPDWGIENLDI